MINMWVEEKKLHILCKLKTLREEALHYCNHAN